MSNLKVRLKRYPSNENPHPILEPRKDVKWECDAVFNPCVVRDGDTYHMLYRTYPKLIRGAPKLKRPGYKYDNRCSSIGYAHSEDGINFHTIDAPFISPSENYDRYGCEDPRITKIDDTFYITYTAIDGELDKAIKPNVRLALAVTKDFKTIEKKGVIVHSNLSKAGAFFPERFSGDKIALILTASADTNNSSIFVRYFDNMESVYNTNIDDWNQFFINTEPTIKSNWWLDRGPELGAPPIKTDKGWLIIFSAESMSDSWTITAGLLDLENPHKLIARTSGFLLQAVTNYEREGIVPNVTFPEGAITIGDDLYVYYGAADTVIGLATCKVKDLLEELENNKLNFL